MRPSRVRRFRAVALAAALIGWSGWVSPRLPARRHPVVSAALGTVLVLATRPPLGLRPPALWSGLRVGSVAAATVAAAVAATTVSPTVRDAMAHRAVPDRPARWLALRIPLGTVWAEEAAYRAALGNLAADGFGPAGGRLVQAAAFGLSHIADARAAGESVAGTVLVTGLAGWLFGRLADRSASLAAPMLAHLAANEAGALAVLLMRRPPGRADAKAPETPAERGLLRLLARERFTG